MGSSAVSDALVALGVRDFAAVLVHSSFKGLAGAAATPDDAVTGVLDACGEATTPLFPGFTFHPDHGPDQPPVMDVRESPSVVGIVPETARRRGDGVRSWHPTHSVVAFGPRAAAWTAGHERCSSPCDAGTPFGRLLTQGGAILLLGGVTQQSNTTLHCLEEIAGVPYHLQPELTEGIVIDAAGTEHRVRNRLHQWGWPRDFCRIDPWLTEAGVQRTCTIGTTKTRLVDAGGLADLLLPRLREDPELLLAR